MVTNLRVVSIISDSRNAILPLAVNFLYWNFGVELKEKQDMLEENMIMYYSITHYTKYGLFRSHGHIGTMAFIEQWLSKRLSPVKILKSGC
jgi:hypothetical protein